MLSFGCHFTKAQDLAPRAYIITPINSNAVTLIWSLYDGSILFSGAVPITDATARVGTASLAYTRSIDLFGRTANFTIALPYGTGHFRGDVIGNDASTYRSGLLSTALRFSVNLRGGPAMNAQQYALWRQKTILGLGLKLVPPTGQYDPTGIVNYGSRDLARIMGRPSDEIESILGYHFGDEVIHRNDMVLL